MTTWTQTTIGEYGTLTEVKITNRGWIPEARILWWTEAGGILVLQRVNEDYKNKPRTVTWQHRPELSVINLGAEICSIQYTSSRFLGNSNLSKYQGYLVIITGKADDDIDESRLLLPSSGNIITPPSVKNKKKLLLCGSRPLRQGCSTSYTQRVLLLGIKQLEPHLCLESIDFLVHPLPDTRGVMHWMSSSASPRIYGSDYVWKTGQVFFGFDSDLVYELVFRSVSSPEGNHRLSSTVKGSLEWLECSTHRYVFPSLVKPLSIRREGVSPGSARRVLNTVDGMRDAFANHLAQGWYNGVDLVIDQTQCCVYTVHGDSTRGSIDYLRHHSLVSSSSLRFRTPPPSINSRHIDLPTETHKFVVDGAGDAYFQRSGNCNSLFRSMLGLDASVPVSIFPHGAPAFLKDVNSKGDGASVLYPPAYLVAIPKRVVMFSMSPLDSELIPTRPNPLLPPASPSHPVDQSLVSSFRRYHRVRGNYATMTVGWIHLIRLMHDGQDGPPDPALNIVYTWLSRALIASCSPLGSNPEAWADDGAHAGEECNERDNLLVTTGEQLMGLCWLSKKKIANGSLVQTISDLTRVAISCFTRGRLVDRTTSGENAVLQEEPSHNHLATTLLTSKPSIEFNRSKRDRHGQTLVGYHNRSLQLSSGLPSHASLPSDVSASNVATPNGLKINLRLEVIGWTLHAIRRISLAIKFVCSHLMRERMAVSDLNPGLWASQSISNSIDDLKRFSSTIEVIRFVCQHLSYLFYAPLSVNDRVARVQCISPALYQDMLSLEISQSSLAFTNTLAVLNILSGVPRSPGVEETRSIVEVKQEARNIAQYLELRMKDTELFASVRAVCAFYLSSVPPNSNDSTVTNLLRQEAAQLLAKIKSIEDWSTMSRLVPDKVVEVLFLLGLIDEGLLVCKLRAIRLLEHWGKVINEQLIRDGIYCKEGWGVPLRHTLLNLSPSHEHAKLFFPVRGPHKDEHVWNQFMHPGDLFYITIVRLCFLPVLRYIKFLKDSYYRNGVIRHEGNNLITRLKMSVFTKMDVHSGYLPISEFYLSQAVLDWNRTFGEQLFPFDLVTPTKGDVHLHYLLFQIRDSGDRCGDMLVGPQAASFLFTAALAGWMTATKRVEKSTLQHADLTADRATFSLRDRSFEGPEQAQRLITLERDWGIITEALVMFRLAHRSKNNKAVSLVERQQMLDSAMKSASIGDIPDKQINLLGSSAVSSLSESHKQNLHKNTLIICKELCDSTQLLDIQPILRCIQADTGVSAQGLSSAIECLSASDSTSDRLLSDCSRHQEIIFLQRALMLASMESLIVLLRRCNMMDETTIGHLFHPIVEVFSQESKEKIGVLLRDAELKTYKEEVIIGDDGQRVTKKTNSRERALRAMLNSGILLEAYDSTTQGCLEGLAVLRKFIVDFMSSVYPSMDELTIEFLNLVRQCFATSGGDRKFASVPPLPLFHVIGVLWIEEALKTEYTAISTPKSASTDVICCFAYNERDREVTYSNGPSILIGSELGIHQRQAWAIFSTARQSLECRLCLSASDVGPLVDAAGGIVKQIWRMLTTLHKDSCSVPFSAHATDLIIPNNRWMSLLLTESPFVGRASLLGVCLSSLHVEMNLAKWDSKMTAQRRLLFPMVCLLDRLDAIRQEPDHHRVGAELSNLCVRHVVNGVKSIYDAALLRRRAEKGEVIRPGLGNIEPKDLESLSVEAAAQLGKRGGGWWNS
eukprot:GHVH01011082.1.p1 GENE.GHVH01011082.1~~GHVH01011082.1.p1  ORF type:complete len:1707 (+),score=243.53 GHVH01011082.1:132-5252(+)